MISNHLAVFLAVGVTWWLALLHLQGICYGPQGQGDVRRRLQPKGRARGVQQSDRPQPPSEYTSMAREVYGPQYDPSTEDLDGEVVMRVGGGKRHGRYWIGDGAIDLAATPCLS